MKLKRGDAPLGGGVMRFGPMTAVLFLVVGFGLSSILHTLGSLDMSSGGFGSSFVQLYRSFGQLLPICDGPKVRPLTTQKESGRPPPFERPKIIIRCSVH